MQANSNRLRTFLKGTKILLTLASVLTIIFQTSNYTDATTLISVIWLIIIAFSWAFENYIWKIKWVNKLLKFSKNYYCPDISGRWEGVLKRDNKDHDFVIEIKQTYTTISCCTYSHSSYSSSFASEILYDQQNETYSFIYLWKGKTENNPDGTYGPTDYFYGTTILRINDNCTCLDGSYFTGRSPTQTKGTIKLSDRQKELKNSFES